MEIEKEGFDVLDENERKVIDQILEEDYSKIQRLVKNELTLKVQVKVHEKKKSKKYSIHVEAIYPGMIISAQAHDYDLARTAHEVINEIKNGIEHKHHVSEQH